MKECIGGVILYDETIKQISKTWKFWSRRLSHKLTQNILYSTWGWRSVSQYSWIAINKRLKFGDGKGAAPFQSAIIYLGKNLDRFNDMFGKYGTLYVPHKKVTQDVETPLIKALS